VSASTAPTTKTPQAEKAKLKTHFYLIGDNETNLMREQQYVGGYQLSYLVGTLWQDDSSLFKYIYYQECRGVTLEEARAAGQRICPGKDIDFS
jgi:hypothetical protein